MGGGNFPRPRPPTAIRGLSPRGRGKRLRYSRRDAARRSIPAWAGETQTDVGNLTLLPVYPRVGGGNFRTRLRLDLAAGLSPRGRGKLAHYRAWKKAEGSIPAWAGETIHTELGHRCIGVYPRVGGGNPLPGRRRRYPRGLSPRGRGKPRRILALGLRPWSIPAWAGETLLPFIRPPGMMVYPRVGGGNLPAGTGETLSQGLSPRGRGKPIPAVPHTGHPGSIPAWAGETDPRSPAYRASRVYPRVGGGNRSPQSRIQGIQGLSPRGRGKPRNSGALSAPFRSIPAWAGET